MWFIRTGGISVALRCFSEEILSDCTLYQMSVIVVLIYSVVVVSLFCLIGRSFILETVDTML